MIFDNNERRLFDMAPYLHVGRFAELKNIEVFKQISISFDTVEWENGLDLDPEFLYARSDRMLESAPTGQRNGEESGDASGVLSLIHI